MALALAAEAGGAAGLRIAGFDDVAAVRARTRLPIIGLVKRETPGTPVTITPSVADVIRLAEAGADIIAFDATRRERPARVADLCAAAHAHGCAAMADVSTQAEAEAAIEAGADIAGTTLAGYTADSPQAETPDFALMRALAAARLPYAAEGRIWTPAEARQALDLGALFVVVGSAITRPDDITRRFVRALEARHG